MGDLRWTPRFDHIAYEECRETCKEKGMLDIPGPWPKEHTSSVLKLAEHRHKEKLFLGKMFGTDSKQYGLCNDLNLMKLDDESPYFEFAWRGEPTISYFSFWGWEAAHKDHR